MRAFIFFTCIFFLSFSFSVHAQCLKGITTNPAAPVNPEKPSKTNTFFDWRQLIYNINSQYILTPQIDAPFNQTDNSLVNHFLNNQDRLPEDGWELIKYDMGYTESGTPKTTPVGYIYLILYNKHTGVLRAFFAGDRPQAFNGAKIKLLFSEGTQSSALSNASKLFALDVFEEYPEVVSVSPYNNNNGKWFYADFNITYDPCTCFYESTMKITVNLINSSNITLSGTLSGSLTPLTDISGNTGTVSENSFSFDSKGLVAAGKKAQKSYKDFNKFKTDQEKALKMEGKTDAQLAAAQLTKRRELNAFQEALKKSSFLKAGLKAVPYVAGALELVNFFVAGGKKTTGPQEVKISPMAINADISLKGTLEASYQYGDVTFYTPGSLNAHIKNAVDYPYYNEVLGVFNLLETPKFRHSTVEAYEYFDQYSGDYEEIRRDVYQVAPIKYVINSAAGFKMDNIEIYCSIEFEYGFKTEYLPLNAFNSLSFHTGYRRVGDYNNIYEDETLGCTRWGPVSITFLVNLQRTDADENTQNVLLVMKYPLGPPVSGYGFTYSPSYCDYSKDIALTNTTVASDVSAWNSITIGPNTTFTGNRTITANNIIVKPGTVIPPNVTLKTGLPYNLTPSQVPPSSISEIQSFCNSTKYNVPLRNALQLTAADEDTPEKTETIEHTFIAYPNPATDFVTFQYYVERPGYVKLRLQNITGNQVGLVVDDFMEAGIHEVIYDGTRLEPGIYLYSLETEVSKEVKRLVIIR